MKNFTQLVLITLLFMAFRSHAEGFVIVTNSATIQKDIPKRELRDIFMGINVRFDLNPIVLSKEERLRYVFNTKMIGLTETRIKAFWAQQRFSGRASPPKEFKSVEDSLAYIAENKNVIAYLPNDIKIPEGLNILYSSE